MATDRALARVSLLHLVKVFVQAVVACDEVDCGSVCTGGSQVLMKKFDIVFLIVPDAESCSSRHFIVYFLKDADFKFNLILIVIIAGILFSREYYLLVHGMYL